MQKPSGGNVSGEFEKTNKQTKNQIGQSGWSGMSIRKMVG